MAKFGPGAVLSAIAGLCVAGTMILATGCQAPRGPVSVNSDDPDLEILAMKRDAVDDNKRDIPKLVSDLQSDDPAIRFYSIETLFRLTHDDFGYHYYDNDEQRAPAVARWQKWLKESAAR
jgi:hypothetical protein